MRGWIGLAVLLLVLGLGPMVGAQTPTSRPPTVNWSSNLTKGPLYSTQRLHGWTPGFLEMWGRLNPFPSRPRVLYSKVPEEKDQPGLKYLKEFGYRVPQPAQ